MSHVNYIVLLLVMIVHVNCQILPSNIGTIKADLEKGGRAVCKYCYGCMFTGLCGASCSGNTMCELCSFKTHCDTTCVGLCQQPDPCATSPCPDNKICQELTNGGRAYRCVCQEGKVCEKTTNSWETQSIFAKWNPTKRVTQEITNRPTTEKIITTPSPTTSRTQEYPTRQPSDKNLLTSRNPFLAGTLTSPSLTSPVDNSQHNHGTAKPSYSTTGLPGYWFY
ncbi:hypothetical protein LOTGIDRAFT_232671 [Lottia gigantea]|uniref:EGF-like domain-containing protein n=1 Tax=Lottia gigantea TaxID=225164 RepID=V3ZP81_LOTGI|nr:hypothetical protein LOTGIDRAFT_232671 [Lottia gigantea]ESO93208.1 hypothetical protein LOTGIDRAFT_232671 [Lottia gigantea]